MGGGLIVAVEAIKHLLSPSGTPDTHWYVFAVIAVALGVDLARTVISLRTARRYGSPALRSNGFHFAGGHGGLSGGPRGSAVRARRVRSR
jgi:divalent metal cation (Fe/Co/Zn/Cd) transporter